MFTRIKGYFDDLQADTTAENRIRGTDELHLAAVALLVHAATVDAEFDAAERAAILDMAATRFGLGADEAAALLHAAEHAVENSVQLLGFTRTVKDRFSYDERVRLIEMLWRVVHADGRVDAHESQLMRRIAGLIYVTDRDVGLARRRVHEEEAHDTPDRRD